MPDIQAKGVQWQYRKHGPRAGERRRGSREAKREPRGEEGAERRRGSREAKREPRGDAKNRAARLMREEGLQARRVRKFCVTTDTSHEQLIAPNTLVRHFDIRAATGVRRAMNRVWVADITYLPTREGSLYLSAVLGLASRRAVGWATRTTLGKSLATSELAMALRQRMIGNMIGNGNDTKPYARSLLHHSDRGRQRATSIERFSPNSGSITA